MTSQPTLRLCSLVCVIQSAGCFPSFDDRPGLVTDTQILAIQATPAEAAPSQTVTYDALVVGPEGRVTMPISWAYCLEARTADERGVATASCSRGEGVQPVALPTVVVADACARFGPNPPPSGESQGLRRPSDPDPTGGYYVPVRAQVVNQRTVGLGLQRVRCDLAGATRAIFDAFQARYRANENPAVDPIVAMADGEMLASGALALAGDTVTLRIQAMTTSAEPFVVYNADRGRLDNHTETLTVSWHVTGGAVGTQAMVMAGDNLTAQTTWTLPSTQGQHHAWAVIRDSRRGVTWHGYALRIEP